MNNFSEFDFKSIEEVGILPVICIKSQEELEVLMDALVKTPIKCIEITLRHPFAPKAIEYIKSHYPKITVGAGTIVTSHLLKTAIKSGADFFVSPGFDENIIKIAKRKKLVFLPGITSPSEILKAKYYGFKTLKLFPAECVGGAKALKLYGGAFPDVKFIPTGGITRENLLDYILCDNVIACGGSFMISKEALKTQDSETIYSSLMECLDKIKEDLK